MRITEIVASHMKHEKMESLHEFLSQAKVQVSFWGARRVTVEEAEGYIPLSKLAWQVIQLGRSEGAEQHCIGGNKVIARLGELFNQTEQELENRDPFTRFMGAIRRNPFLTFDWVFGSQKLETESDFLRDNFF